MKPIAISIMRRHIEAGRPQSSHSCPLALALKEALLTEQVTVSNAVFSVNHLTYDMTEDMKRFVHRFDAGKPVGPRKILLSRPSITSTTAKP